MNTAKLNDFIKKHLSDVNVTSSYQLVAAGAGYEQDNCTNIKEYVNTRNMSKGDKDKMKFPVSKEILSAKKLEDWEEAMEEAKRVGTMKGEWSAASTEQISTWVRDNPFVSNINGNALLVIRDCNKVLESGKSVESIRNKIRNIHKATTKADYRTKEKVDNDDDTSSSEEEEDAAIQSRSKQSQMRLKTGANLLRTGGGLQFRRFGRGIYR
jgi:hypothetical protein